MPFPVFPYPVHHHEMLPVPVDDAGQRGFFRQLVEGETPSHGMEPDLFHRPADTRHRDPVATDKAVFAQVLQRVALALR